MTEAEPLSQPRIAPPVPSGAEVWFFQRKQDLRFSEGFTSAPKVGLDIGDTRNWRRRDGR